MKDQAIEIARTIEGRIVWTSERPITFEQFLDLSGNIDMGLIDGVLVQQEEARLMSHERLFGWLICLLSGYVQYKGLGIVLGSRTAVEIGAYGGRLPDILFVRQERMDIVRQKAIYGAPDL